MSDAIITVENLGKKYPSGLDGPTGRKRIPSGASAQRAGSQHSPTHSVESGRDWVVYAIQNTSGRIYIGQTGNWDTRSKAHNGGSVRSTRTDGPWRLVAFAKCPTQSDARWLEFQLKRSRGKRIKWLEKHSVGNEW
jgi:predicted GIY-YIG superfamily endonuclease